MPRRKVTTTTRQARGRERALADAGLPLVFAAALDAVARHRAAGEPLERALADVSRARRLGPRERRAVGDAIFSWARLRGAVEGLVDDAVAEAGGIKPSRRDRDLAALLLAEAGGGADPDPRARARLTPELRALVDEAAARGLPAAHSALPAWLDDALRHAHGDAAPALVAALGRPAPLVLAFDPRHVDAAAVMAAIAAGGAEATPSPVVPDALRVGDRKGRAPLRIAALPEAVRRFVWPMDDGSQAVAAAVEVRPGELVLDLCAGGGGKARFLSARGARVVAADLSPERLAAVPADVLRVVADGRAPPFRPGTFDKVLLDAPCSGTGTLRRAPDLARRQSADDVARFAALQRALLEAALALVRPGGRVVYATCSLLREENDDVVDAALRAHPDVTQVRRDRWLPHIHGTDGFFASTLLCPGSRPK